MQIAVAIVTIPATLSLVFSLSERACRHGYFARDYKALQSHILKVGEWDFTDELLNTWRAQVSSLEASEPRQLTALVLMCQREIAVRAGYADHIPRLPLYQRALAHLVDFAPPYPTRHS